MSVKHHSNWQRRLFGSVSIFTLTLITACSSMDSPQTSLSLNSRYLEEQPAISGDGRTLAFISNRNGNSQIYVYNLRQRRFMNLPGLNRSGEISQSPSLSRTGRYIVYICSIEGRPDIVLYDRAIERSQIITERYRSWVRNPRISPNGRYIVFETARRGQWDIELDTLNGNTIVNGQ